MSLIEQYSKEELEQIVKNSVSYRETLQKLGYTYFGGTNLDMLKKVLEKNNIDYSHFTGQRKNTVKRTEENTFCENSTVAQSTLRKKYYEGNYSEYICAICGIDSWNGKKLTLRLDHINGINNDDRLENLRWVCPNCDSQLDTFCKGYKNKMVKKYYCIDCNKEITAKATRCVACQQKNRQTTVRPSREELKDLIRNTSFTQIGKMYNVSDNSIRKWCDGYNLPRNVSEIKKYSDKEWKEI